ncbi:MAG TPA: hypothetical protein VH595_00460 [Verrucomicrobiae bacterium]|nr:hypothetical protein [Verrucomicrobiae bacterium]
MINRKLCIMACCLGMGVAIATQAQPAAGTSDDQKAALDALRQAEKGQPATTNSAPAPTAPATATAATTDAENAQALEALRRAEGGHAAHGPVAPAPAPAPAPTPAPEQAQAPVQAVAPNPADNANALEALRRAERGQVAPAAEPNNAQTIQAQKQAEAAQAQAEAARSQQSRDAERAAEEKALADKTAEEAAARQSGNDNAAASAALQRQKAQDEVAQRLEKLQGQIKSQPAPTPASTPTENTGIAASKEQRLADLLRRYRADEITPLEYHTERAKIIAEP